jgi:hypothetical protein
VIGDEFLNFLHLGGVAGAVAGVAAGAGAALESLVTTSAEIGSGSIIGSLASMSARGKSQEETVENPSFQNDDLTGDKAVAETLQKGKKDSAQQ